MTKFVGCVVRFAAGAGLSSRSATITGYTTAVLSASLTLMLLIADNQVYKIYDFHINGFVINLVTTPGGLESMGMSNSSMATFGVLVCDLFAGSGLLLWAVHVLTLRRPAEPPLWKYRYLILLFALVATGERVAYGVSNFSGATSVLVAADRFPLYQPLTFRGLAKKIGL